MANTKISQLPSYTGTAADVRWFVMNNSGETETYKYSGYTSPFVVENYTQASIFSTFGVPVVYDADCVGSTVIGSEAVAYDDYTTLFGWKAIGNNDIEGRCSAFGADAQASSRFSTALGMSSRASGSFSTAVGHNASAGNGDSTAIGALANASGYGSTAVGKGATSSSAYSSVIGGVDNTITGVGSGQGIFVGQDCDITATGTYNTIINGFQNVISGTSTFSSILGGNNNTINNLGYVAMLGCSGRTADTDNTTYVERLRVFGQLNFVPPTTQTGSTITLDMNNGNVQRIVVDTTSLNLTLNNVRNGSTYEIITQPTASVGSAIALTISASGFTIKGGSGYNTLTANPNAARTTIVVIDNVMYISTIKPFV